MKNTSILAASPSGVLFKELRQLRQGGAHADIPKGLFDGHHTPAKQAYKTRLPLTPGDGPAIRMSILDHSKTASYAGRAPERQYRAAQEALIAQSRFRDALAMDIANVCSLFNGKYEQGIQEMINYVRRIERASPELLKPLK